MSYTSVLDHTPSDVTQKPSRTGSQFAFFSCFLGTDKSHSSASLETAINPSLEKPSAVKDWLTEGEMRAWNSKMLWKVIVHTFPGNYMKFNQEIKSLRMRET